MANPFEDLVPGGMPTPTAAPDPSVSGGNPFADLIPQGSPGATPSATAGPSSTPHTDSASAAADLVMHNATSLKTQAERGATADPNFPIAQPSGNAFWDRSGRPLIDFDIPPGLLRDVIGPKIGGSLPRYSEESYRRNSPLAQLWPDPPLAVQRAGGYYNTAAGLSDFITSPRGLVEGATTALFPPAAYAFAGAEMVPGLPSFVPQVVKRFKGELPPAEAAEVDASLFASLLPFAHAALPKGPEPFLPAPPMRQYPLRFPSSEEIPGVPFSKINIPPDEEVGPVEEQTDQPPTGGASGATTVKGPGQIPGSDQGTSVDEEASLRGQQKEPSGAQKSLSPATPLVTSAQAKDEKRLSPVASVAFLDNRTGEVFPGERNESHGKLLERHAKTNAAVASGEVTDGWVDTDGNFLTPDQAWERAKQAKQLQPGADEFKGDEGPPKLDSIDTQTGRVKLAELTPEEMTAKQLEQYIAKQNADPNSPPVPLRLSQLLKEKQAEEVKSAEAQPAVNKQPLNELLSPEELGEYQGLINQWATLDREGGKLINDPTNPRAWEIAEQQKLIRKRIHEIQSQLPDGDVYDVISIGAGATGGTTGLHGGAENLKTIVLEHTGGRGTASAKTGRYSNVKGAPSPLGQSGPMRELVDRLQGMRMGTEYHRMSDIESYEYDPKTKIFTVKTKGLGKGGEGGETLRGRILSFATGTRPRNAPFKLLDAQGKPIVNTDMGVKGQIIHLDNADGMRAEAGPGGDMGAIGAANSSAQGAVSVADKPNSGVFHLVVRGPDLASVSDYLLPSMKMLKDEGKLQVHFASTVDHVEAPSAANGNNYVIVTKKTPPRGATPEQVAALPEYERIPVKAVGSFIGSVPNTSILPENFLLHPVQPGDALSGLVRTDDNLRPLRLNEQGKEETIPGMFVGGSVRAAEGVNRMATAEGEGSRMVALALDDLKKMKSEGLIPAWKTELRQTLQSLGDLSKPNPNAPQVGPISREHRGKPGTKLLEGGKPLKVPSKGLSKAKPDVPPPPLPQNQQDQEQRRAMGRIATVPRSVVAPPPGSADAMTAKTPEQSRQFTETNVLIERQKTKPQPLTDGDRDMLFTREGELRTQYNTISQDLRNARLAGDDESVAENDSRLSETLDKFAELNYARKRGGEPDIEKPPEQFSLEQMINDKSAMFKGRPLTPFEIDDVRKWQNLINEKKATLEAYKGSPEAKGYWDELRKRAETYKAGQTPPFGQRSLLPDKRPLKLQSELIKAQHDWEASLEKDRLSQMTWWQKAPDYLLKWRRAGVISGFRSVGKLGTAAVLGTIILPAREGVGTILKHLPLIDEVAKRAPGEGYGFNIRAEALAQSEMWKNLISDMGKNIKGEKPDFENVFGTMAQQPKELQNYVGYLHSVLKSPLARNEFTRRYQQVAEFEAKHGADLTDPMVQMQIGGKAVESSVFWRFQNRNTATRFYRQAMASLERQGYIGKGASYAIQAENPIVTVPSNVLARTFEGVFGSIPGGIRLGMAYRKGIENLSGDQADLIMRNLKTAGLGAAFTLIGAFNPQYFGGFYRPGGKKDSDEPGFGATRVPGTKIDIPPYLQDNPFLIMSQFGATTTQVANSYLRKTDADPAGYWMGFWSAIYGAASSHPFIREAQDVAKLGDPRMSGDIIGEHARSYVIPQLLQQIAEMGDPEEKRFPRGVAEQLMMGIPGLRENVSDVLPVPQQQGTRRRGLLPARPHASVRR